MHFEDISWVSFIRKSLPDEQIWLMQQHLSVSCEECIAAYSFWGNFNDWVVRESTYEPDASDIRVVTSAFSAEEQKSKNRTFSRLAVLIFDSFQDVAPAGFRSALMQARHVVFRVADWTISLRIKNQMGNQISLAGHITAREFATQDIGPMEVFLSSYETPIANVTTNRSGEFQVQYPLAPEVRLLVKVSPTETLEIPLPALDLAAEEIDSEE
jgi:hypothetical protein